MTVGAMRPNRWTLEPLFIAGPATMLVVSAFLLSLLFGGLGFDAGFAGILVVISVFAIGAMVLLFMVVVRHRTRRA